MRLLRRLCTGLLVLMCCAPAAAHPLGNFTINHLAKITAAPRALHVRYILDIAEIPTFQIVQTRANGNWSRQTLQGWANDEIALVQDGFHVAVDGRSAAMVPSTAHARFRPGAGGLPILRWVGEFAVPLPAAASHRVSIDDRVYADRRIGWKDVIAGSQTEPTDELQHYPSALIGTPRRIGGLAFQLSSSGAFSNIRAGADAQPMTGSLTSWIAPSALSDMFSRPNQTPWFVILTILAAFGLGALHAIEPGHGKALLAFTLVGARATSKQALILATSLTFAHTAGVLLLGIVLFFAAGFVSETIYPWITLLSGLAIAVIGARALAKYVRMRRGLSHAHVHRHEGAHPHAHGHEHAGDADAAHGHGHSHAIPGSQPLDFRSAVWAAMSGGIAPCPAAIVVLLAALRLHQLGYGVFLIVIFSMGLAAVLSGLGIGVVHGADWLSRRSAYARFVRYGPLITAAVISIIGSVTLAQGFVQQGARVPVVLVAALALAAIAGYAFSGHTHLHGHAHMPVEAQTT